LADGNQDGKLTRKELVDYLDMQATGASCWATVNVNDLGRGLFEQIDADGDNRLSVRELRNAWERVKKLARDGKGLAKADIPRKMQISLHQGNGGFRGVARPGNMVGPGGAPPPRPHQAPGWVRKMDLNNHRGLSPPQVLGPAGGVQMPAPHA